MKDETVGFVVSSIVARKTILDEFGLLEYITFFKPAPAADTFDNSTYKY